jgi:muramoyltetrapeptide carboxypeptidase
VAKKIIGYSTVMDWNQIVYPRPLKTGDTIGVTALSSGVEKPAQQARLDLILSQWRSRGFQMLEGQCLREDKKNISAPAKDRADELMKFWSLPEISAVMPPWGGERLIQILEHLDFDRLAKQTQPKWLLGYSDISTLLFALTLRTGMATAHGAALMDLIENQTDDLTNKYHRYLSLSAGESFTQHSFSKFQKNSIKYEENVASKFNLEYPVEWKSLKNRDGEKFSGRIIGGCLDTLMHLVGTPFGDLPSFVRKFQDEGVVLYLENCEMNASTVARALTQLKYGRWFDGLNGIIFGRSAAAEVHSPEELTEQEAIESVLGDTSMPVILDADIGHRPPQMLLINGSFAEVTYTQGSGSLIQTLRS